MMSKQRILCRDVKRQLIINRPVQQRRTIIKTTILKKWRRVTVPPQYSIEILELEKARKA
jgi:hypothetical protein